MGIHYTYGYIIQAVLNKSAPIRTLSSVNTLTFWQLSEINSLKLQSRLESDQPQPSLLAILYIYIYFLSMRWCCRSSTNVSCDFHTQHFLQFTQNGTKIKTKTLSEQQFVREKSVAKGYDHSINNSLQSCWAGKHIRAHQPLRTMGYTSRRQGIQMLCS